MTAKEVIKILKKEGWKEIRQRGGHKVFKKPNIKNNISVPFHSGKDIRKGTLSKIFKEANIEVMPAINKI